MNQSIRFCMTPDDVQLAYAVSGDGPPLVMSATWLTHLEHQWRSLALPGGLARHEAGEGFLIGHPQTFGERIAENGDPEDAGRLRDGELAITEPPGIRGEARTPDHPTEVRTQAMVKQHAILDELIAHGVPARLLEPKRDFDHYLGHNMVFDTAGFCGAIGSVKTALVEIPASRIVFATDYPQEIRAREAVRDFVRDIRALGADGERILSGNVGLLLK